MYTNYSRLNYILQNILIKTCPPQDWWVKLSDFGLSKRVEIEYEMTVPMGTEKYTAPELIFYADLNGSSTYRSSDLNWPAADMWSLGQLACRVVTGMLAFENRADLFKYYQRRCEFPLKIIPASNDSLQLSDFVSSAMHVDPLRRLTIDSALIHPWVRSSTPRTVIGSASTYSLNLTLNCR